MCIHFHLHKLCVWCLTLCAACYFCTSCSLLLLAHSETQPGDLNFLRKLRHHDPNCNLMSWYSQHLHELKSEFWSTILPVYWLYWGRKSRLTSWHDSINSSKVTTPSLFLSIFCKIKSPNTLELITLMHLEKTIRRMKKLQHLNCPVFQIYTVYCPNKNKIAEDKVAISLNTGVLHLTTGIHYLIPVVIWLGW